MRNGPFCSECATGYRGMLLEVDTCELKSRARYSAVDPELVRDDCKGSSDRKG